MQTGAAAGGVALVEDKIEDVENGAQTLSGLIRGGQLKRDAGIPDALFGAADALGHGGFRHEERLRDFGCGETSDRPQCESDR